MVTTQVHGRVEEGFGKVADAFASNFDKGELGAAFCLYVDGKPMVDIWGGIADSRSGRAWTEDTLALVFSVTKGATATCVQMLAQRGELDVDAPVAAYWPEFATSGKQDIPVRWLLCHKAGLPAPDGVFTVEEACAWEPVVRTLAAQKPMWEPGTAYAYHAITFGFLVGEVVRRVSGRTLGRFFAEEVAGPLGLESWIGLPSSEEHRVAHLLPSPPPTDPQIAKLMESFLGPDTVMGRALSLGGAFPVNLVTADGGGFSLPQVRAAEFPAANMVTTARSLARMYAATVGEVDGVRLLEPDTLAAATQPQTADTPGFGTPPGMPAGMGMQFSLGYMLPSAMSAMFGPRSFGHTGAGGSLGLADAEHGIGFGYACNQMAGGADPRTPGLIAAARESLGIA